MTTTTIGSTGLDDAQLARRLPPDLLRTVLAYEDELQAYRAAGAVQAAAMRQVKIDAAQAKDKALQAAIAMVLDIKRKTLIHDKDKKDRANFIMEQLERAPVGWGLPVDYADHVREKDIKLIRAALRAWEKINGCSGKSRLPY